MQLTQQHIIAMFIAAVVAIFISDDARKRGMSRLGWGLFVFSIMIIGLPMYFWRRKPLLKEFKKD